MAKPSSLKTKVSTKGQVILPKAIRDRRGWTAGAELIVEDKPEGVLARSVEGRNDAIRRCGRLPWSRASGRFS